MIELFEHLKEESGENRVDFGYFGKLGNSGRSNSAIHLTAASPFSQGHGQSVHESDFDPNISIFCNLFKKLFQLVETRLL
jgi:hypothetical protein